VLPGSTSPGERCLLTAGAHSSVTGIFNPHKSSAPQITAHSQGTNILRKIHRSIMCGSHGWPARCQGSEGFATGDCKQQRRLIEPPMTWCSRSALPPRRSEGRKRLPQPLRHSAVMRARVSDKRAPREVKMATQTDRAMRDCTPPIFPRNQLESHGGVPQTAGAQTIQVVVVIPSASGPPTAPGDIVLFLGIGISGLVARTIAALEDVDAGVGDRVLRH